jgi:hypothetical protein
MSTAPKEPTRLAIRDGRKDSSITGRNSLEVRFAMIVMDGGNVAYRMQRTAAL